MKEKENFPLTEKKGKGDKRELKQEMIDIYIYI